MQCNFKFCRKSTQRHTLRFSLRKKILETVKLKNKLAFFPPTDLCTDNGAMIAWAGYELYTAGVKSKLNMKAKPRWPLESIGERV